MELSHLLHLVDELPKNSTLNYVRGTDICKFIDVDIPGERINSVTPTNEPKSWAPSYLSELATKIKENVPFNISGILNNKGSFRPVLETIIAHTREFYTVRKGTATALVWIPSKPKATLELEEIEEANIPEPLPENEFRPIIDKKKLEQEMKNGFTAYFSNYLRMSTGKCEESKINQYFDLYTRFVENPIRNKYPNFSSIFAFDSEKELTDFFKVASKEIPNLIVLLLEKYPQAKEEQTLSYEPWTMIRHYKVFLQLLKSLNQIAISINPNRVSISNSEISEAKSDSNYLRAMRTKPFLLLAGISGTGKSRIVKQMAFDSCPDNAVLRSDPTSPGNYCLIEVKPNWHDSTELLGYESKIGGDHYQLTPFVKFLAKAMLYTDPAVPFFVCLDEMNLAPVEQYFAEFLSVLESRTKIDGHIVSEPLIKAEIFRKYDLKQSLFSQETAKTFYTTGTPSTEDPSADYGKEAEVYELLCKHGLRIPENVVVIGTVNMDETTHQFSRKVIDRAMTIEMNLPEGDPFMDFFNNSSELAYRSNPTSPSLYLANETKASEVVKALAKDNTDKTEWLKEEVAKLLTAINTALDGTPFKVAYRVQNELMLYFYQLWLEDKTAKWRDLLNIAVDQILMMKVLPRIEGDNELLEKSLESLIEFSSSYPNATKKLKEMKSRLERSQFTSFWP